MDNDYFKKIALEVNQSFSEDIIPTFVRTEIIPDKATPVLSAGDTIFKRILQSTLNGNLYKNSLLKTLNKSDLDRYESAIRNNNTLERENIEHFAILRYIFHILLTLPLEKNEMVDTLRHRLEHGISDFIRSDFTNTIQGFIQEKKQQAGISSNSEKEEKELGDGKQLQKSKWGKFLSISELINKKELPGLVDTIQHTNLYIEIIGELRTALSDYDSAMEKGDAVAADTNIQGFIKYLQNKSANPKHHSTYSPAIDYTNI